MAENHIIDRIHLRFSDEVKIHFAFLEALGFQCVRCETTLVRFESSNFAINIYHGRQSYEINLEIQCLQTLDTYSYGAILRLIDSEQAKQYRNYATHTVEGVAEGVHQLAERFRKCVGDGILNDNKLFSRLKLQRAERAKNYALETQLEQARKMAASAWQEKDFEKVVQAFAPLQEYLNSSELKKFEYAKQHIVS